MEGNLEEERQKKEIHEWPYYYLDGVWYEQVKYVRTCISKLKKCLSDSNEKRKGLKEIIRPLYLATVLLLTTTGVSNYVEGIKDYCQS